MSGQLNLTGAQTGAGVGTTWISEAITLSSNASAAQYPASGTFQIAPVAEEQVAVMIVPPIANTATLTLKGVTGDTGFLISPTQPTVISLPATNPSIYLEITGTPSGPIQVTFL